MNDMFESTHELIQWDPNPTNFEYQNSQDSSTITKLNDSLIGITNYTTTNTNPATNNNYENEENDIKETGLRYLIKEEKEMLDFNKGFLDDFLSGNDFSTTNSTTSTITTAATTSTANTNNSTNTMSPIVPTSIYQYSALQQLQQLQNQQLQFQLFQQKKLQQHLQLQQQYNNSLLMSPMPKQEVPQYVGGMVGAVASTGASAGATAGENTFKNIFQGYGNNGRNATITGQTNINQNLGINMMNANNSPIKIDGLVAQHQQRRNSASMHAPLTLNSNCNFGTFQKLDSCAVAGNSAPASAQQRTNSQGMYSPLETHQSFSPSEDRSSPFGAFVNCSNIPNPAANTNCSATPMNLSPFLQPYPFYSPTVISHRNSFHHPAMLQGRRMYSSPIQRHPFSRQVHNANAAAARWGLQAAQLSNQNHHAFQTPIAGGNITIRVKDFGDQNPSNLSEHIPAGLQSNELEISTHHEDLDAIVKRAEAAASNLSPSVMELLVTQPSRKIKKRKLKSHVSSNILSETSDGSLSNSEENTSKRYSCTWEYCGKTFSTSGHLARHNRIHLDIRPFKCTYPECTSHFSRQDNMRAHLKIHFKKSPISSKKIEKKSLAIKAKKMYGSSKVMKDIRESEPDSDTFLSTTPPCATITTIPLPQNMSRSDIDELLEKYMPLQKNEEMEKIEENDYVNLDLISQESNSFEFYSQEDDDMMEEDEEELTEEENNDIITSPEEENELDTSYDELSSRNIFIDDSSLIFQNPETSFYTPNNNNNNLKLSFCEQGGFLTPITTPVQVPESLAIKIQKNNKLLEQPQQFNSFGVTPNVYQYN